MMVGVASFLFPGCSPENDGKEALLAGLLLTLDSGAVRMASSPGSSAGLSIPTNLAGIAVSSFGDGTGDGYTDRFLDPEEVALSFYMIYAWKSPEAGGPAQGQATIDNADYTLFNGETLLDGRIALLPYAAREDRPAVLRGLERVPQDADRIGLVISSVSYQYATDIMEDPMHQSISLEWGNYRDGQSIVTTHRGRVFSTARDADCGTFFSDFRSGCEITSQSLGEDGSYTCSDFEDGRLHSCRHTSVSGGVDLLEYDFPSGASSGQRFVQILSLAENTGSGKLYINIDPSKTLFLDSNDPVSRPFDWYQWTQSKDAQQDLKFYLPVMWVTTE